MLKNIRLHLHEDEKVQDKIEQDNSDKLTQLFTRNVASFKRYMPSLASIVGQIPTQNISIFLNKDAQLNIVDYGTGRTLYGLHPQNEIKQQYELLTRHCTYVDLSSEDSPGSEEYDPSRGIKGCKGYLARVRQPILPDTVDVMVVMGIGLGDHLQLLLEDRVVKHLIIFEPELQYFKSSMFNIEWKSFFELAQQKGTSVYIQLQKDGRDLVANINELKEHFAIHDFYLYRHYNHPIFLSVELACLHKSWKSISEKGLDINLLSSAQDYAPTWTEAIDSDKLNPPGEEKNARFEKNLQAFKKYIPLIYQEFHDYKPSNWLPAETPDGQINILKSDSMIAWHGDQPRQECVLSFNNYSQQPHKDGLIMGYTGTKLAHYSHYQFVQKTEKLLTDSEESKGELPAKIKSLIVFGVGVGYQLEYLIENHQVDKLFLCEPNRDFFYASLYAIDWHEIITSIDKLGGRLYLNIGDDGSNLFRDLLNQFYSIGPYILASTYFYQTYYNTALVEAIAQLREQLQIVIAMGEYYDHARYGIAHTKETIRRGYPFLQSKPEKRLRYEQREVPVFIVGNGPSLDSSFEAIKECADQAVIVSCGTALMPLYKNGIVPDFHAEIEQNRATFDWCARVGSFEFLKQVSLLSCNGIHPDTCDLFKDVFIAFKDGESSTVSALEVLGKDKYSELKFAFPTVSNFVLNLFSAMGFKQIYLIGVDLGFVNAENHHSKQSGYYTTEGKETYDYQKNNNTSIALKGNFRKRVFTKHEFKVAKSLLEESLRSHKLDCYNCSDGAYIEGTTPLKLEHLLLVTSDEAKQNALAGIKQEAFKSVRDYATFASRFNSKFNVDRLGLELEKFCQLSDKTIENREQVFQYVDKQKEMLFSSYRGQNSLLFYLLYGTVNYANALLSKLAEAGSSIAVLNEARSHWEALLESVQHDVTQDVNKYDTSNLFVQNREEVFLKHNNFSADVEVVSSEHCGLLSSALRSSFAKVTDAPKSDIEKQVQIIFTDSVTSASYPQTPAASDGLTLTVVNCHAVVEVIARSKTRMNQAYCWLYGKMSNDLPGVLAGTYPARHILRPNIYHKYVLFMDKAYLFVPKFMFFDSDQQRRHHYLQPLVEQLSSLGGHVEFPDYIAYYRQDQITDADLVDVAGNRGVWHAEPVAERQLVLLDIDKEQLGRYCKRQGLPIPV